jgi:hypothetical protein
MAKFKAGDRVVWTNNLDDPSTLKEGTVSSTRKEGGSELVMIDGEIYYSDFMWPARVKEDLLAILVKRQVLKKAYDDSMKLIYQLSNKISRGEL